MNRIISLAAYVGLSELPAYFQEQIRQAFKYVKGAAPNDDNTECYLRKEQDRWYTVTVNFIYSEDEIPEIEDINQQTKNRQYLTNLSLKAYNIALNTLTKYDAIAVQSGGFSIDKYYFIGYNECEQKLDKAIIYKHYPKNVQGE